MMTEMRHLDNNEETRLRKEYPDLVVIDRLTTDDLGPSDQVINNYAEGNPPKLVSTVLIKRQTFTVIHQLPPDTHELNVHSPSPQLKEHPYP
jgi:hypothetical protein